jgi:hypothetical protein
VGSVAPAQASLLGRLFPGGTIGTRVELWPPPDAAVVQAAVARLTSEPLVEHVDAASGQTASLRLSLRSPVRWPELVPLLERALPGAFQEEAASWVDGVLRLTLAQPATPDSSRLPAVDDDDPDKLPAAPSPGSPPVEPAETGDDWLNGSRWDALE